MTNIISKSNIFFQINRSIRKQSRLIKPLLLQQQQQRLIQTNQPKLVHFFYNSAKYTFIFSVTCGLGLITGLYLSDSNDEDSIKSEYQPTRIIENKKNLFPLRLHLYQYDSCANCSQIKAYLDYFGYSYKQTEVDSFSKNEILSFTTNRTVPLLTFQNREYKQQRWNLTNTTAIISALESLRNYHSDFHILNKYLPILDGNEVQHVHNPFKYHVRDSNLNSTEWRKWIDETAVPVFKLNSISNLKDIYETFDMYAERSNWNKIYSNQLRYYYVYYMRVLKAYFSENAKLKAQLLSSGTNPRKLLTDAIISWENGLTDNLFINGNEPNLADISMYGIVKSYIGCTFLKEAFEKHSNFLAWYKRMKDKIDEGYIQPTVVQKNPDLLIEVPESDESVDEPVKVPPIINAVKSNQISQFRILTAFYMCHVVIFTYAAYMAPK